MLSIVKNNETSSKCFTSYSIIRDGEVIASAILTHNSNSIEVFKKYDRNISSEEYEFIINNIRH